MRTNQQYLDDIKELVKIRSVCERELDEYHYGKGVNDALNHVIKLCQECGFNTNIVSGRCGYAEIGSGDEMVGILVHIDTVPEGQGWHHDPFGCEIADEKMYGRGVIDDKGPAIAVIYALKDLLDSGETINKRFRIIFGTTEETGNWDDLEIYKKTQRIPSYGFTPDGYFPCVSGEKGILQLEMVFPDMTGFISVKGGTAANVVPDECSAEITVDGITYELDEVGKAAHGTLPEKGINAISKLMTSDEAVKTGLPFIKFYNEKIGMNYNGENWCYFEDEVSGKLTMNVGKIDMEEDGIHLLIDLRYPVTEKWEHILKKFTDNVQPYGCKVTVTAHLAPVYMDKEGKLIRTLLKVYRDATGDDTEPMLIGGGTYARAMDNIVAFGPMLPGREETEHQANECILVEDLYLIRKIYGETVRLLNRQEAVI